MLSKIRGVAVRAPRARFVARPIEHLELRTLLSGPITITAGGTYSGTWESLDPTVPAVTIATADPVVIENSVIRSRGDLIASSFAHAKITVRNVSGYGLNPNVYGRAPGRFFDVEQFDSADIHGCYLENTGGIYMLDYAGNHTTANSITVHDNKALNIDGRKSDGAGGWLNFNTRTARKGKTSQDGMELVQFLQFDKVRNVPGIDIGWNEVINQPGNSRVEDNINIYLSSGSASSPMLIHDNYIQGAYTIKPGQASYTDSTYNYDWSFSGGGILIGDGVSTTAGGDPGYIKAFNNQVVSTTNYGIAIAAGHDEEFFNNRVLSAGVLSDGTVITQQNVGLYVWDSYSAGSSHFYNDFGHDNVSGWVQGAGRNDWWSPTAGALYNNTHWAGTLTTSTEQAEYALWQQKLSAHAITAPGAPDSLVASSSGTSSIHLTWADHASNETCFRIERSGDGGNGWAEIGTTNVDVTTYDDTKLSMGTSYFYRVRATNSAGNSAYSNIGSATTDVVPPPAPPSHLNASAASYHEIDLTWTDNADNESGFVIERSPAGTTSSWTPLATPAADATHYSDTSGLTAQTQYFYRIQATNLGGSSAYSDPADATTGPLTAPAAPTQLAATAASYSKVDLVWTDNSDDENYFVVERSPDGSSDWTPVAQPAADATTWSDITVAPTTTYYYRIYANGPGGDSGDSNTDDATTPQAPPAAPSGLSASAASASEIDLTWTDNAGNETGLVVQRSPDGINNWTAVATPPVDATTCADKGLPSNTTYYYRVYASGVGGNSSFSNVSGATTLQLPPTAPSNLAASAQSSSSIKLTWTDTSSNEAGFSVERSLTGTGNWSQIATPSSNATSYTDSGLSQNTAYFYRVLAVGPTGVGNSSYSSTASATTLPLPPAAPANLLASALSGTSIKLTWSDLSNNESGFRIERSTNGTSWTQIATVAANATTYTNTGLNKRTKYYYRIVAYNTGGASAYSNTASATTLSR